MPKLNSISRSSADSKQQQYPISETHTEWELLQRLGTQAGWAAEITTRGGQNQTISGNERFVRSELFLTQKATRNTI